MIGGGRSVRYVLLAVLAAVPVRAFAADELGRLFTTPGEREQMDHAREGAPPPTIAAPTAPAQQEAAAAAPGAITLRGIVDRDDGRSTAWVNDSNTWEGDAGATHRRVERSGIAGGRAVMTLPQRDTPLQMKVGQTWDPAAGRLHDLAEERAPDAASLPEVSGGDEDE